MQAARPKYVLAAEAERLADGRSGWRFSLVSADGRVWVTAADVEPDADDDRLTLLAVVRGLEAIDHPADVTLVTPCGSVRRAVARDLERWRNAHWRWERFGRLTPIRDADLWRRVDRCLRYHEVRCRTARPQQAAPTACPRLAESTAPVAVEPLAIVDGRLDSPAMVVVRSPSRRRRVRLAPPVAAAG